jgi:NAD(P) transhydrogenase subunit beta
MLVAWAEFVGSPAPPGFFMLTAILATAVIGAVTFSGSMAAFAKLAELLPGKPVLFRGQQAVNLLVVALILAGCVMTATGPAAPEICFTVAMVGALALGILSVIPIGGADMPVVICLLNSYSGLAACAAGFIVNNNVLIVSGALVGASGLILTKIMCKAMNRPLTNVLFGGFGAVAGKAAAYRGEPNPIGAEDAYFILEAADSVVFVPGYGMAVAQAQHVVRELGEVLAARGTEVKYCIHPVAGRMPGHMNVLLAEANVPYDQLVEPGDVNPIMNTVDVAIVIGANDVVNPAAREDKQSPLWGMPIIDVDLARTCIVLKRSMNPGFAGVDNPLFFKPNTRMLFGDAKAGISALVAQFKDV